MQWSSGDRNNIKDMRGRAGSRAVPIGIGGVIVLALLSWASLCNQVHAKHGAIGNSGL